VFELPRVAVHKTRRGRALAASQGARQFFQEGDPSAFLGDRSPGKTARASVRPQGGGRFAPGVTANRNSKVCAGGNETLVLGRLGHKDDKSTLRGVSRGMTRGGPQSGAEREANPDILPRA
jgi:hypothetical protein